jgi:regulator of sigma E protease
VDSVQTLKKQFADYENQQVQIEVERNQESLDLVVDLPSKAKKIGVILSENQVYKFGFLKALWIGLLEGAKLFGYTVIAFGTLIKNLIFTGQVSEFVTGPVGIYYITSSASKLGAVYVLQLVSLISINLAVVNLLPIPALDGGRIVFNILEGIRGKSIGSQLENTIHAVGYIFLILLVGLVFYRDIVRIPYYQNLFN